MYFLKYRFGKYSSYYGGYNGRYCSFNLLFLTSLGYLGIALGLMIEIIPSELMVAYAGRPFLGKYGKHLFIHKKHIDTAEAWFNKYDTGVIFAARFIPIVRHAISIPAGISKMSLKKFTLYTVLAVILWSFLFIYLGNQLSSNCKM